MKLSNGIFTKEGKKELKYLAVFALSLFGFWLCEAFIKEENCHVIYSPLDDLIPFCEAFVVFYCLWHLLLFASVLYFALFDKENFRYFLLLLTVTQAIAIVIFLVFPNKQLLRPAVMPRENIFTKWVFFIYSVDTNTNVTPSLHVAFSGAIFLSWQKEICAPAWMKYSAMILDCLAAMSTVMIKQHSVVDVFVALIVFVLSEKIVNLYERKKKKQQNENTSISRKR